MTGLARGEPGGVDRGRKAGRRAAASTATFTSTHAAPERDRGLPGEGEPEASAAALGGDAGVLGMQMSRNNGGKRRHRAIYLAKRSRWLARLVVESWASIGLGGQWRR
jgi:hypothetical protein